MAAPTSVNPDSAEKLQKMISSQKSLLAQAKAGRLRLPDGGAKIASKLEELEASLLRLQFRASPRSTISHSSPQILTSSLTNLPPAEHQSLPSARSKVLHASNPNTATAASTGRIVEREIPMYHDNLAPSVSSRNERPPDIAMAEATMAVSKPLHGHGAGNPNTGAVATTGRIVAPPVSGQDERPPDIVMAEATSTVAVSDAAVEILHGEGGGGNPSQAQSLSEGLHGGGGGRKLDGVEAVVDDCGRGRGLLQQAGVFPLPANTEGREGGRGTGGSMPLDRVAGSGDRAVTRARVAERGHAATERAMARFLHVYNKVQVRAGSIEPVGGRLRPGAVQEVREQVMKERGSQIDREAERLSATLRIVEEEGMELEGASSNGSVVRRTNLAGTVQDSFHSSGLRSVHLISISEAADLLRAHNDEVKKIEEGILARSSLGRQMPSHVVERGDSEDDYDDLDEVDDEDDC